MSIGNNVQKCVAALLSLLVPVAIMASDLGGTVTASSGVVTVNGQLIRGSYTMFPGDSIETENGKAVVRLTNGELIISENSSARFESSAIQLDKGFAQISGSKELTARYRDLTIRSVGSEGATFVIGELQGKPTVATLKGAILVTDGSGSLVLPAGRAMESAINDDQPTAAAVGQEGQAAEPAVKGGHASKDGQERGGKKNRRVLAGWVEVAVLAGIIGGTLGALALGGVFDKKPISNQVP
jgi:hypothetical protein